MRKLGSTIWKKTCAFFKAIRQLLFLALFVIIAFLSYLYLYGLPKSWKDAILGELATRGVHIQLDTLFFDPFQGVVARGIKYSPDVNEEISIREMALKVNLFNMFRKHFAFDYVEFDGSDIQVSNPTTETPLVIHKTEGRIRFAKNGIIYLESVVGELFDVRLELNGRMDLSKGDKSAVENHEPGVKTYPPLDKIENVLKSIRSVDPESQIHVQVRFDAKIRDLSGIRAKMEIESGAVTYNETYKADKVTANFEIADHTIFVPNISISSGGGKISLWGTYQIEKKAVEFELMNNLNPESLIQANSPAQVKNPFREFTFNSPPVFWIKGTADFKDRKFQEGLKGELSFKLRDFSWRGHAVKEANGYAHVGDSKVVFPSFNLIREFGRFNGSFTYDIEKRGFDFDVKSSLDLAEIMMLLYPSQKNWFRTVTFKSPPSVNLKGTWLTRDPNGLNASGIVDWKDWSSRDVSVQSTKAQIEIKGRKFIFKDFELVREEGKAGGNFDLDFSKQNTTLDVVTNVHFADLARLIGPKIEETLSPYHFPIPPTIQLKGVLFFEDDENNDLNVHIEAPEFKIWKFSASNVSANVRSFRKSLEISRFTSNFYDGELKGDAIFDFTTPQQDWAFHCKVVKADFDKFTHDLWNYEKVNGYLTGWTYMSGTMKSSKELKGYGEATIDDGVLWKIPLFGELSKFIPILGEQKATKGITTFTVADEKVNFDDMKISAGIMSLTAKGIYQFNESIDFIVQGHFLRAFFGIGYVLDPFTKAFEYHLGGKLNARVWKPRFIPKELLLQFGNDQPKAEKDSEKDSKEKEAPAPEDEKHDENH